MNNMKTAYTTLLCALTCTAYAMDEKPKAKQIDNGHGQEQPRLSKSPPTTVPQPSSSISSTPLMVAESPQYEEKSWSITRGIQAMWYNDTQLALAYTRGLTEKPKSTIDLSNKVNRGINDTIGVSKKTRKKYDEEIPGGLKTVDGLQIVARLNEQDTEHLAIMIDPCHRLDISLNLESLTEAYRHLKVEDTQDLLYIRLALSEAQKRLKTRKALRKTIYEMNQERIDKDSELGEISDDEFDDQSMFKHLGSMQGTYQEESDSENTL